MIMHVLAAAVALVASATRPGVDDAAFRQRIVAVHNAERAEVGSPPLEWSDDLARDASAWGSELARGGGFRHDPGNDDQGENLWMGTRGYYSLERMLEGWVREKRRLALLDSWESDSHAVGHYTQMVWHGSTRVGCAVTHDASDEFLVCRYDPPGNWRGESPYAGGGMVRPSGIR